MQYTATDFKELPKHDGWFVVFYGSTIPCTLWYDTESGWQFDEKAHDKIYPTHWLKLDETPTTPTGWPEEDEIKEAAIKHCGKWSEDRNDRIAYRAGFEIAFEWFKLWLKSQKHTSSEETAMLNKTSNRLFSKTPTSFIAPKAEVRSFANLMDDGKGNLIPAPWMASGKDFEKFTTLTTSETTTDINATPKAEEPHRSAREIIQSVLAKHLHVCDIPYAAYPTIETMINDYHNQFKQSPSIKRPTEIEIRQGFKHKYRDDLQPAPSFLECWTDAINWLLSLQSETGYDLISHLHRQRKFSQNTFGPGDRLLGVLDHIRRELKEIEAKPDDITEWIDLILLAFDGAWRRGFSPEEIAKALEAKQTKNENRQWPDWKTSDPNKAIEHIKPQSDK